jgi:hypothetical protein
MRNYEIESPFSCRAAIFGSPKGELFHNSDQNASFGAQILPIKTIAAHQADTPDCGCAASAQRK